LRLQTQQSSGGPSPAPGSVEPPLDIPVLTRRMAQGDESAYRTFYDAYANRLFRYLLVAAAGDEESAREALQAALVRVVRHIRAFPDDTIFWSWLTVLARSALSDQGRKRRRYLAFLDRFTRQARGEPEAEPSPAPGTRLLALLEGSLETLLLDERQIIEAKYFSGQSVRDIAGKMALSEKAVESRLTRIRQKLKTAILAGLKHE
jgi:RNA polymerase sigma factor (sigma-70 family)